MRIEDGLSVVAPCIRASLLALALLGCREGTVESSGGLAPAPGSGSRMDGGVAGAAAPARDAGTRDHDADVAEVDAGEEDAGVTDDDAGAVGPIAACGTRGAARCEKGAFCHFPVGECGAADRGGSCEPAPEVCTEIFQPVCGCDLRSYGNECEAQRVGVSILHTGACTVIECRQAGGRPELSDGASTPSCQTGESEWALGGVDEPGLCCAQRPGGETCGGIAALECDRGEFCNYEPSAGGQGCDGTIADAAGVCQPRPEACDDVFRPVCGCDRRSYANECEAHAAGASQLHSGACTEIDCEAVGGHPVDGIGPGPMCPAGETMHTFIGYSSGMIAIEGTACCVPR